MSASGAAQFRQLAVDLSAAGSRAVPPLRAAMALVGNQTAQVWKSNATATAGQHGKHYPNSITSKLAFSVSSIAVDVYPDPSKPQGGMSFEFGSSKQPPHLDGDKAVTAVEPLAVTRIDAVMQSVIP